MTLLDILKEMRRTLDGVVEMTPAPARHQPTAAKTIQACRDMADIFEKQKAKVPRDAATMKFQMTQVYYIAMRWCRDDLAAYLHEPKDTLPKLPPDPTYKYFRLALEGVIMRMHRVADQLETHPEHTHNAQKVVQKIREHLQWVEHCNHMRRLGLECERRARTK